MDEKLQSKDIANKALNQKNDYENLLIRLNQINKNMILLKEMFLSR